MGWMAPTKYITSAAGADFIGGGMWLQPDQLINWHFLCQFGGTLAGTLTVKVSDDPRARQNSGQLSSAIWLDATSACAGIVNPAGAGGTFIVRPSGTGDMYVRSSFIRLEWDNTGGSGTIDIWFAGMST